MDYKLYDENEQLFLRFIQVGDMFNLDIVDKCGELLKNSHILSIYRGKLRLNTNLNPKLGLVLDTCGRIQLKYD